MNGKFVLFFVELSVLTGNTVLSIILQLFFKHVHIANSFTSQTFSLALSKGFTVFSKCTTDCYRDPYAIPEASSSQGFKLQQGRKNCLHNNTVSPAWFHGNSFPLSTPFSTSFHPVCSLGSVYSGSFNSLFAASSLLLCCCAYVAPRVSWNFPGKSLFTSFLTIVVVVVVTLHLFFLLLPFADKWYWFIAWLF